MIAARDLCNFAGGTLGVTASAQVAASGGGARRVRCGLHTVLRTAACGSAVPLVLWFIHKFPFKHVCVVLFGAPNTGRGEDRGGARRAGDVYICALSLVPISISHYIDFAHRGERVSDSVDRRTVF